MRLCLSFSMRFEFAGVASWLDGWRGEMLLHHTPQLKNHELLLMSFPSQLLEILLDPKQISGASHLLHFVVVLLLCCVVTSLLLSLSSLAVSADWIISSMISSITLSSFSSGWLCSCSLLSCKNFRHMRRSS
jgi:hypothetical protein